MVLGHHMNHTTTVKMAVMRRYIYTFSKPTGVVVGSRITNLLVEIKNT